MKSESISSSGQCAFCGNPEATHRIIDAIVERIEAGEDVQSVARDFGMSIEVVAELFRQYYELVAP